MTSLSRRRTLGIGCALAMLLTIGGRNLARAQAQPVGGDPKVFEEPVAGRVYQRDDKGFATIPVVATEERFKPSKPFVPYLSATTNGETRLLPDVEFIDGALVRVPTGGPYKVHIQIDETPYEIGPFFVGDLWVLAGQSNMEGVGNLEDVEPPHEKVMLLGMEGKWRQAAEPLHWLIDSPDPVHSGDPKTKAERSKVQHKTRKKGAGLGLPFAKTLVEATGVPIGLIPVAHGGTSMEQWSPSKKDEGGNSLYGSMLRQVKLAGGKVKGMLWYQGESDALGGKADEYPKAFADFIAAVREDFDQPHLPFYLVQIGRVIGPPDPKGWNAVQEAQRLIPEKVPDTAVVSVVDLELDDGIHVGTQGLKRAGARLAHLALLELYSHARGLSPIALERVDRGPDNTLRIKFQGVNTAVQADGKTLYGLWKSSHIPGFSIRKSDGTEIPLIFEATTIGQPYDTLSLKLNGPIPKGAKLWHGYGLDPFCNLTDQHDMAVPVFGPIDLDEVK